MFEPHLTTYLFAQPSFMSGMASAFDLSGSIHIDNDAESEAEADQRALAHDWIMVGSDLRQAMLHYAEREHQPTTAT